MKWKKNENWYNFTDMHITVVLFSNNYLIQINK